MSLLLDTHVWIWSQESPEKLGRRATAELTDTQTALYVSTISTLEIARLVAAGLIELSGPVGDWVTATLDSLLAKTIGLSHEIAAEAYALPEGFHKDPADRILAATARIEHLTLVSADERILAWPHVPTLDARK